MANEIENINGMLTQEFKESKYKMIKLDRITKESAQTIIDEIQDFIKKIQRFGQDKKKSILFIFIHSVGGNVYEAMRIINAMDRAKKYCIVSTIVDSSAFSAALPVFCRGTNGYRFVSDCSTCMIHQPSRVPKNGCYDEIECFKNDDGENICRIVKSKRSDLKCQPKQQQQQQQQLYQPHLQDDDNDIKSKLRLSNKNDKHFDMIKDKLYEIIINTPNDYRQSDLVRETIDNLKDKDWFLDSRDMQYYGLANHIGVPDFIHKVEYIPMLSVGDLKVRLS